MTAALIAVAVLAGLLALLAVPVNLDFRFEGIEPLGGQVTIRWLFGAVALRVPLRRAGRRSSESQAQPRAGRAPAKGAECRRLGNAVAILRQAELRRRVLRLLRDLVAAARFHELRLRLRLGLGDPADTGLLWAFLWPLATAAHNLRNADVRIEPEFIDAAFEFRAAGRLRLIPLQIVALAIGFILSPVSIRAWRMLASSRA